MVVAQLRVGGFEVFAGADDGLHVAQARGEFALLAFACAVTGEFAQAGMKLLQALPAGGGNGEGVFAE